MTAPAALTKPRGRGETAIEVRPAQDSDIESIRAIYAHHVLTGLASFETEPPSVVEMAARRRAVLDLGLPYLVAERERQVVGYAYATAYRPRKAYRHTIEDSVYVTAGLEGLGIGKALLLGLLNACELGPWRQMIAVIGNSGNAGSIALHSSLGFERVGVLKSVGFKFGRWLDTVLMQRSIGAGAASFPALESPPAEARG